MTKPASKQPRAAAADSRAASLNLGERLRQRLIRDAAEFGQRWRGDADRRGVVLVMTMLMITLLTLLGSAAIMQTTSDIKDSGSHRVERAVSRITEAATMGAVGLAGRMGAKFDDYARAKNGKLSDDDFGGTLLNLSATGQSSFGRELTNLGKASFSIEIGAPELSSSVAGYQSGKYCFQSYRVVTLGHIGDADAKDERERGTAGESGLAAQVVVGPALCSN